MASIPYDLATHVGVTTTRSAAKLHPDTEPFAIILQETSSGEYITHSRPEVRSPDENRMRSTNNEPAPPPTNETPKDSSVEDAADEHDDPTHVETPDSQNETPPSTGVKNQDEDVSENEEELSDELSPDPQASSVATIAAQIKIDATSEIATAKENSSQESPDIITVEKSVQATELPKAQTEAALLPEIHHNVDQDTKDSLLAGKVSKRQQASKSHAVSEQDDPAKTRKSRKAVREAPAANTTTTSTDDKPKTKAPTLVTPNATESNERSANQPTARRTASAPTSSPVASLPVESSTSNAKSEPQVTSDASKIDAAPKHSQPVASTTTSAPSSPPPRLQEHLVSTTRRKTGDGPNLSQSDQNRFVQRVARAFDAAKNRDGEIRLRLSPPELGSLRLEIRMQQGGIVARLEAETQSTRTLLIDNLPALRERLAEQGVHIEQFDVDLLDRRDQGQQRDPNQTPNDGRSQQNSDSSPDTAGEDNSSAELKKLSQQSDVDRLIAAKRINLII